MADAVNEPTTPLARPPAPPPVSRHRFGIAYLALAAILGAGVGLAVVLAADGNKNRRPAWSAWKPTEQGVRKFDQISKYVESQYSLPSGHQLVGVLSTPPEVQSDGQPVPVRAIGVASGLAGETFSDARFYDAVTTWTYELCGLGDKCAIPEGKASVERRDLLRREALELALYTFKYESRVQAIVAYLPAATSPQDTALFFSRDDVSGALEVPLAQTLPPPKTRLVPGQMSADEIGIVRAYTPTLFQYQYRQLPDGTLALVLRPPPA